MQGPWFYLSCCECHVLSVYVNLELKLAQAYSTIPCVAGHGTAAAAYCRPRRDCDRIHGLESQIHMSEYQCVSRSLEPEAVY